MRSSALELLEFLGLADRQDQKASDLPYGEQRKLEMARALATAPQAPAARRAGGRHEPARDRTSSTRSSPASATAASPSSWSSTT